MELGVDNKDDVVLRKIEKLAKKYGQELTHKQKDYIKNFV